ncbi:MAG TPA: NAD+ synthase [Saprospiraceae bacterium]|nr:NAD+ synthase [Saprospiraceae bacterium]HNT21376.1 NAD+ synthase [Saprospiraceae bacterium]
MRIVLAQINSHIGNFEANLNKILESMQQARSEGADLIVFPELATCGYPPRDFLEFKDFIHKSREVLERVRLESAGLAVLIGSPAPNPAAQGKDLHNAAFFIHDGKILHQHNKSLLPTYDIFDEYRYFEPSYEFKVFEFKGYRIALTICEDLWNLGNANPLYTVCPLDLMMDQDPDLIFNISASPFAYDHAAERIEVVRANVLKYGKPLFYCNTVGAQTDVVFDGGSLVFSADGRLVDELPYFEEVLQAYEVEKTSGKLEVRRSGDQPKPPAGEQAKEKYSLIHDALLLGIRDYFGKLGFKSAILGLSGGIDSALTATLAVRALGRENVNGLMMPSRFSSKESVEDAVALAKNLGIRYEIIEIEPMYSKFLEQLSPILAGKPFNVTEENIQARIRGTLLMAASNKEGHILLNTTNKSEMSVGYGTLYGDLCGGLSVLGDVYKTEVYQLVNYINKEREVIPRNSILKPPSAELRPGQKDTDSLPAYEQLDPILYHYIEKRLGPDEIISMGYEPVLVRKILRMVNINEFKREQTAPVIRVSPKAFGMGRRMPIVGKYLG